MDYITIGGFTKAYEEISQILDSEVGLFRNASSTGKIFHAIWDTGATNTSITKNVIDKLGLEPVGKTVTNTANGKRECFIYFVSIVLPNNLGIPKHPVFGMDSIGGHDVLIGMDIIGLGDFAVTNYGGKTVFSYRYPSLATIDFVKDLDEIEKVMEGKPTMAKGKKKRKKPRNPRKKK